MTNEQEPAKVGPDDATTIDCRGTMSCRLGTEDRGLLYDLWRHWSNKANRPMTLSDVIRRCIRQAIAAVVVEERERQDKDWQGQQAEWAKGMTSGPPAPAPAPAGSWQPPRKPRKGGGTVIDLDAVRAEAHAGVAGAIAFLDGMGPRKGGK